MITADITGLEDFCARDVFGTRVAACQRAYEGVGGVGAAFAVQRDNDGAVTAAVSNADGAATVCCAGDCAFEELAAYLKFVGATSVLCDGACGERLGLSETSRGSVVEATAAVRAGADGSPAAVRKGADGSPAAVRTGADGSPAAIKERADSVPFLIGSADERFSFKGVYETLAACGFSTGAFPDWRADLSLRIRRETAETLSVVDGGTVAATASALFVTEQAVLLGAVGTLPPCRGKGYAGALVGALARRYTEAGKRVELLCEPHRLSFYVSLGFRETGQWLAGTAAK